MVILRLYGHFWNNPALPVARAERSRCLAPDLDFCCQRRLCLVPWGSSCPIWPASEFPPVYFRRLPFAIQDFRPIYSGYRPGNNFPLGSRVSRTTFITLLCMLVAHQRLNKWCQSGPWRPMLSLKIAPRLSTENSSSIFQPNIQNLEVDNAFTVLSVMKSLKNRLFF